MSNNVRYVKLEVMAYLEIPADQAGIDNFAKWPPLAGALDGFEKGSGTKISSLALKIMDEDFNPNQVSNDLVVDLRDSEMFK